MQSQQKEKIEKTHMQEEQMQSNNPQNRRRESEAQKMHARQDRIIKNQSQNGEMIIKNIQNKKENAKNESMLSEQYVHKKNIIEIQSQRGRSMVEMLGVLAIIGVLSIGGITGYKYAMNYYQANQIAHEMNIMRTDAKIKIAQGTDELILGDPYDDGNINFNNYETDFDCALADDAIIEENVSCRVANAFYIEMKNISQEICRPLSKLIQGMSELIGFEITTETIEADNEECQEGNNNIHAVFSAEAISELKSCKENTDCEELENTPYCDKTRHVCVKCYEDNQCAHTEYCEDNTCKSCDEGLVWNGEECVECTENDDCADISETPVCNRDTNKCVECTESTECSEPLVCRNNECTTCQTEEECKAKGENYHCSNEDTCIQCGTNEVWGGKEKGCVECTADDHCSDTPDTPKCNTNINQCVECLTYKDCQDTPDTPKCNTENRCEACPKNNYWDGTKCAPGCKVNANCENGNYCHLGNSSSGTEQTGVGSCQSVAAELIYSGTIDSGTYYGSKSSMTWFDACHLCAARANYADDTKCNKPLNWSPTDYMADYSIVKCTDKETKAPATGLGWNGNRPYCIVSERTKDLREFFGNEREKNVTVQIWMGNGFVNSEAYDYRTGDAYLHSNTRNDVPNGGHALCH